MKITATAYEPGPRTRELRRDTQLLSTLMEAHQTYIKFYTPALQQFQGQDYTGQLALVWGTTELVPEIVDARSAVGLRSGSLKQNRPIGDAALCVRCRQRHYQYWTATFVLSSTEHEMPHTPIFGALCVTCHKAVIAR